MRIGRFIKDKWLVIGLHLFIAGFSAYLLYMVAAEVFFVLFVPCTYILGCFVFLLLEYLQKSSYYKKLYHTLNSLDRKTLLCEIIDEPSFLEGLILYDVLKTTDKAMNDEIASYKRVSSEYREYIELWVHEIKTPIAGAKLICENLQNEDLQKTLDRIERFVDQALYYSRSNSVEKDFIIKELNLKEMIHALLRKESKYFINRNVLVETDNLDFTVYADSKWMEFIFMQLFENAVKYESKSIKLSAKQNTNSVSLSICDDGIGILAQDINRVFHKGFTGENGRKYAKSTGLGLYLCKELCLKLGLNIRLQSKPGEGTTVEIVFPKSNLTEM